MKYKFLPLVVTLALFSCNDLNNDTEGTNACTADDPMEISWIKDLQNTLTDCTCEISVIRGTYDGQTVFFTALTDPLCDGIDTPTLYDCNGDIVRTFTWDDYQEFYSEVTRDEVLYRCKTDQ